MWPVSRQAGTACLPLLGGEPFPCFALVRVRLPLTSPLRHVGAFSGATSPLPDEDLGLFEYVSAS